MVLWEFSVSTFVSLQPLIMRRPFRYAFATFAQTPQAELENKRAISWSISEVN